MLYQLLAFLFLFASLSPASPAASQSEPALTLTLEQAIEIALKKSYNGQTLASQLEQAEQNRSAARGRFRTSADIELLTPNFAEQVSAISAPNQPTSFNTTGSVEWQGALSIRQPLPTNGSIGLRSSLRHRRDSVFLESLNTTQKSKRFFTNARLEFTQPLLVPNALKLGLERANLQLEQAQRTYTRTQVNIIYTVTEAFYALYQATQQQVIAREGVEQQRKSFDLAQQKKEAGLIPEVEALQQEVDLAQSQNNLLTSEGTLSRELDRFKMVVGMSLDQTIAVQVDTVIHVVAVDEQKALVHGLNYRSEVRESEIIKRLAEINLKEVDARRAFQLELSGFYELTGVSDASLPFSSGAGSLFRSSIDDLSQRPRNRGVFLNVTVPLWDSGVNGSETKAARAIVRQRELTVEENRRTVERDIRATLTRLREARGRLEVLRQSADVGRRSYDISLARFDNGDITSQELALDRQRLTQARQAFLDAFIQYQLALADLKRQTLYDFENDRSLIEETKS